MRLFLATLLGLGLATAARAERPVVVELYTSQGCSSCPPAEALLSELAAQPGVLALGFHVTYWNGLGWRDPYSLEAATSRQRSYQALLGAETIYTPQMIVDGRADVIGSDRRAVRAALAAARSPDVVSVGLRREGGSLSVALGAGAGSGRVLLIGYDANHRTQVSRGENAGRELRESNVVRSLGVMGEWSGAGATLRADVPAGDHLAVIVQDRSGRILGASTL